MPSLIETMRFIMAAHEGQLDKSGGEYWMHPVRVMIRLGKEATDIERHVALLHDVIEDTPYTARDLAIKGYPPAVIEAVELLTRPREPRPPYDDFIQRIARSGNAIAIKVKIADMEENMDPVRVAAMPPDERGIIARYERSLPILKAAA